MDNPAFQNDSGVLGKPPKKPLTRANSTLTPTNKSWHLTQAPRSKLCRCNSVLVPQTCCNEDVQGPTSIDYPFFTKKSPVKSIFTYNSVWSKNFWSDSFNRLHDSHSNFQKFPSSKAHSVATIYDPQFLSSKLAYSGSHALHHHQQEPWPGRGPGGRGRGWWGHPSCQKAAAISCIFVLTLLIMILLVGKPGESASKVTWVDVILISGEFRILNEPYLPSLGNHTSSDFLHLSDVISRELDSLFSLSVLSEPYHSTAVTELMEGAGGGVGVHCQLVLRASAQLTAIKVGLTFIAGLRNSHGHVWLGNFSVDIQSIGFQAGRDAVTWTDWSRWGPCQLTQEFGFVQLRSRNCTLRSGQYLHSTLPCLLVPNSQGNIETASCPPPPPSSFTTATPLAMPLHMAESSLVERLLKVTRVDCKNRTAEDTQQSSTNTTLTLTTSTEQSIKNSSLPCVCEAGQVCVALDEHAAPRCLPILDNADPTGCGGHCKINTQLCQNIQDNAFRCLDDSKCLAEEWQCSNRLCIPLSKRCDGHFNCYDHTDEMNCDCVGIDQFTCNDSQCIPNHRFCDGFPDCKDHSDEPFGCGGDCKAHEWRCSNGRCIQRSRRCDGDDNCGDSSDEADCSTVTTE